MIWAVLDYKNKVTALVDQEDVPERGIKAYGGAAVGKYWNGSTFDAPKWLTYEFLQRFTDAELDGCLVAAQTNAIVRRFITFAEAAHEIIADDPETVAGMDYLVSLGLLTSARKTEILTA